MRESTFGLNGCATAWWRLPTYLPAARSGQYQQQGTPRGAPGGQTPATKPRTLSTCAGRRSKGTKGSQAAAAACAVAPGKPASAASPAEGHRGAGGRGGAAGEGTQDMHIGFRLRAGAGSCAPCGGRRRPCASRTRGRRCAVCASSASFPPPRRSHAATYLAVRSVGRNCAEGTCHRRTTPPP